MKTMIRQLGYALLILASGAALAVESEQCRTVRLGTVNWTDVVAGSTMAGALLDDLGYQVKQTSTSRQIVLAGLVDRQLGLFFGHWQPTMQPVARPCLDKGRIEVTEPPTLVDAQSAYVVSSYVAEGGLKIFADIAHFKDKPGGRTYAIEPGSGSNRTIWKMIDDNHFGLRDFQLVESSEAGMPTAVKRATERRQWVMFFGWELHLMNLQIDMTYLTGSEDVFGPDEGAATASTMTAAGYQTQYGNVARLLHNLHSSSAQVSQAMTPIFDHTQPPDAARQWLKVNPGPLKAWLDGMSTSDDEDGLVALQASPK